MTSTDEFADLSEAHHETCKMRFSTQNDGKPPVILANFTNGKLRNDQQSRIKFHCYCSTEHSEKDCKNNDRILLADNGRLHYTGSSISENSNEIRCMVGVRNKRTGKMKLYDSVSFRLKPLMPAPKDKDVTDNPSASNKSFQERRDELTSYFGSKYGKKAMSSRIKYATAADDLAPLAKELEEMPIEKISKVKTEATAPVDIIPPKNLETKDIERVFSISSVISNEEMDALHVEASEISAATSAQIAQWKTDNRYCNYCIHHIEKQQLSLDQYKLLVYFNYMALFSKLTYRDFHKKDVAMDIPEPYREYLLKNYTITSRQENGRLNRNFPLSMKDKILAYGLVLALFIDDFSVNLTMIQGDMKATVTKIIRIAQVLGCQVTSKTIGDSVLKFATLKFPLFVATERRYTKKKAF